MIQLHNLSWEKSDQYLAPQSVDLFVQDPPYFISNHEWDKQWDNVGQYLDWTKLWMEKAYSQLKPHGTMYVFCAWQHSGKMQDALEDAGFYIQNRITWRRDKGRGCKTNYKQMVEDIWFATKHRNNYTFNVNDIMTKKSVICPYVDANGEPKDWFVENGKKYRMTYPSNLFEYPSPFWSEHSVRSYAKTKRTPENTLAKHPTQKPKDLVKKLIKASSNLEEFVVDYFIGSGTTAIACKELNRNCVGFDTDAYSIEISEMRLNNE